MKSKLLMASAAVALSFGAVERASAAVVQVNFDALNGQSYEEPLDYYDGGCGSLGTCGGPDYGVTFSSNAIVGCEQGQPCASTNAANAPSAPNILFFLSGPADTMNVEQGFTTGFSFYYALQVNHSGFVTVYSGPDGTGSVLATLALASTPAPYTVWVPIGVAFSGTAESVQFGGDANYIGFDNVTFGSSTPTTPEPGTWALMMLGMGGLGAALRGSRRKALAAA